MARIGGRGPEAGVTLVEMLVALALFSLIGLAGFGMLSTILRAQERTEGRMQRLADIDGALRLMAGDLETGAPETLSGDGAVLSVTVDGSRRIWRLDGDTLTRQIARPEQEPFDQALLDAVTGWSWRFLDGAGQWVPVWPPAEPGALRGAEVTLSLPMGGPEPVDVRRLFVPSAGFDPV